MTKIAIVSDIHGNRTAFEAIVADLKKMAPDLVVHGGDLSDSGSSPATIVDRIRELGWAGVAGNTDEMLFDPSALQNFAVGLPQLNAIWDATETMAAWTREQLGEERIAWMRSLPRILRLDAITLLHASPGDLWRAPRAETDDAELEQVYASLGGTITLYGHIHRPFVRRLGGRIIANSGSVGLSHDGDRRASYLLLHEQQIEVRRIEYPIEREITELRKSGLPHHEWVETMLQTAQPRMP